MGVAPLAGCCCRGCTPAPPSPQGQLARLADHPSDDGSRPSYLPVAKSRSRCVRRACISASSAAYCTKGQIAIEPAGRLDRDTSGLLICTTDGQLIHRLTNPKRAVWKRYRIGYTGELSAHAVERCASGLSLPDDDRPTLPARLELHGAGEASLHLCEGRYHQVRRMIGALGGEVIRLHRDRIGALELPADLTPGMCRALRPDEEPALFEPSSPER